MSVALDAMGGDHAPDEIVRGALAAAPRMKGPLLLVGRPEAIRPLLPADAPRNIEIVPASQEVGMEEKPLDAYRKKKDSSLMVATRLVKEGRAGAMVSAGNTGAATAHALLLWRQVEGVHRPAIASWLPSAHGGFILLDAGASPDIDPEHLVEFALMGRAYAQSVLGRKHARVHLLNIGEEPGKGSAFAKAGYELLKDKPWFAGNIEGKTMFAEPCDVVVCEGFVGNITLKTAEGVAELMTNIIREGVPRNPAVRPLYWPVKRVMAPLKKRMDYAEIGGSPLLGLNGVCVIAHGRSNARAIENAVLLAQSALDADLLGTIRRAAAGHDEGGDGPQATFGLPNAS
ncbi:phosphate acyltransferase PlsX [bacterium]|nr:MAG: phosphate acyltransferase PlsX [bacterium]